MGQALEKQDELILAPELADWVFDALNDDETSVFWITGGLGSGKSYGIAEWHIGMCLLNQKVEKSWHISATHSQAKLIGLPTFIQVLEDEYDLHEPRDYRVISTAPCKIILKRYRQTIVFHSAAKWQSLVGENISHWSADECGYYQGREWFDRCMYRMRHPKAVRLQGMGGGTPEGTTNSYAELADFEDYDAQNNARRVTLWTDDNPWLRPDYVDQLERTLAYDPGKLESYRYGVFVPFTRGNAYWEFFHSRNVVLDVQVQPELPIMLCWDFNKMPLTWVAMQRQRHRRLNMEFHRFVALDETKGKSKGLLDACAEVVAHFPPAKYRHTPIEIYGDASGFAGSHKSAGCDYQVIEQALKEKYSKVTVKAARKNPLVESRLDRVNALLAYEQYVVAAWCRNLIRSHQETCLRDGQRGEIEKPTGEDWTHPADATGYPLFQLTKAEDFEVPDRPKIVGGNRLF